MRMQNKLMRKEYCFLILTIALMPALSPFGAQGAQFQPARLCLRTCINNDSLGKGSPDYSPAVREILGSAIAGAFTLVDNTAISASQLRALRSAGDDATRLQLLGVDSRAAKADFVLVAEVKLESAFRTSEDIRIPLILPIPGSRYTPVRILKTDETITIHDEHPEFHYTATIRFSLFSAVTSTEIRSWERDDDEQSDRGNCVECMCMAIEHCAKHLFADCKNMFRSAVDFSVTGAADLQIMYGVMDLQSPGIGGGGGVAMNYLLSRYIGLGFEYQWRGTSRELGPRGALLSSSVDETPHVHVNYSSNTFALVISPGCVLYPGMRSLDFLFPHGEIAVGFQNLEVHVKKDTARLTTHADNSWTAGLGAGALMAFRKAPIGVEPYFRFNFSGGAIPEDDDRQLRTMLGHDSTTSSASRSTFSMSILAGIRLSLVFNATPLR
jgi:hypothetical protein